MFSGKCNVQPLSIVNKNIPYGTSPADATPRQPIAELEVAPHDHALMSLCSLEPTPQPQNFTTVLIPMAAGSLPNPADIIAEIVSCQSHGETLYIFHVINHSAKRFCIELLAS